MNERRFLGLVEVDSGTLVIGDPLYLLPSRADGRTGVDYAAVLAADVTADTTSPLSGKPVVLLRGFGGDGTFPLIGEYEDGLLMRVTVEFVEPEDD